MAHWGRRFPLVEQCRSNVICCSENVVRRWQSRSNVVEKILTVGCRGGVELAPQPAPFGGVRFM